MHRPASHAEQIGRTHPSSRYPGPPLVREHVPTYGERSEEVLLNPTRRPRPTDDERAIATLAEIAATVPFGLAVLDRDLRYRFVNPWLAELNGISTGDHLGRSFRAVRPDVAERCLAVLEQAFDVSEPVVGDVVVPGDEAGPERTYRFRALRASIDHGVPAVAVVVEDRTDQSRVERALEESEHRFRALADAAPVMIWMSRPDFVLEYVNEELCRFTGLSADALLGRDWEHLVHPDDLVGVRDTIARAAAAGARFEVAYRSMTSDGSYRWVESRGRLRLGAPEDRSYIGVVLDVDAQRRSQEELLALATSDELTGLANRAAFMRELHVALRRLEREPGPLALLYVDLDGFKRVNDVLGHAEGDRVLGEVAQRLSSAVRPLDLVGRIGGDEFGVLLAVSTQPADAIRVAARIQRALSQPLESGERAVSASVGVAFATGSGDTPDALVRRADTAMFEAKAKGEPVVVYDDALGREVRLRQEAVEQLRDALLGGRLTLVFQPVVRAETWAVAGVEALVRWVHPDRGLLEAVQFIELVADTPLAVEIDTWVLRTVAEQLARWRRRLGEAAPHWIAANLSPTSLLDRGFVSQVRAELRHARLAAQDLIVEISEPLVGDLAAALREPLRQLHAAGVRIAHDDVGEGAASLTQLFSLPSDLLLLSPGVLRRALDDPNDGLAWSLADVARRRGSVLLAEGVETPRHVEMADHLGCDLLQGLAVAPPMEADAAEAWLAERAT